ncbi:hypothetical protein AB0M39_24900 [Streptomyces sp. NPDC051907]|uniref:TRAFAC clade GTPase domain-containing protein n=1 Tax=Streptomyces sp. NPDC051907 TaxID=3155284 RepID=UPI00341A5A79
MSPWLLYPLGVYGAFMGLVALFVALYAFPVAAAQAVAAMGQGMGPYRTGESDPRIVAASSREPAHLSYWTRQLRDDVVNCVAAGALRLRDLLIDRWLANSAVNLLTGRRPSGSRGENGFTSTVMVLTGPGFGLGVAVGSTLAGLFLLTALVFFGVLLTLVCAALAAVALVLRGVDRAGLLARSIRMKCPHPGCYQPIDLPVYHCPGCNAAHRRLRAGRFGVTRRVCSCGRRLRTSFLTGRHKMTAYCPHCELALPGSLGTIRIVHVPIVGGTSSGKTMLMAAAIAGLRDLSSRGRLTVDYGTVDDRREVQRLEGQLGQDGWVHRTASQQPRAFMLTIARGRRRRLLYLYDPMGETFGDAGVVREQQYLAHADGVVLVVDVLAAPKVRRALEPSDAQRAVDARPSPEGPKETYDRLAGELAAMSGRRAKTPIATVVTKRDVLDQLDGLPPPGVRVDEWLNRIGLDDLVQSLEHDFGSTRYWAVSAHAATGAGALHGESRRAAESLLWLLSTTGLPVRSLLADGAVKR